MNKLVPTGFPALPIEYAHLPEAPSKSDPAFYVMPEAVPVARALADKDIRARVAAVQQFAEALATLLKEHGQNHRDVKPSNLYEYEGRFVLGDFELITDPEAESLTDNGKAVGPWAFLPSEVFNAASRNRIVLFLNLPACCRARFCPISSRPRHQAPRTLTKSASSAKRAANRLISWPFQAASISATRGETSASFTCANATPQLAHGLARVSH